MPVPAIRTILRRSLAASLLVLCAGAGADWSLLPGDSSLGFVSVKNGRIVEGHQFTGLSGAVTAAGAELTIELATVDTLIPIRDERMRELLFAVVDFPQATFRSAIDLAVVEALAVGESLHLDVAGELDLHGRVQPLNATVLVSRGAADRVTVATTRPVVISAEAFDLGAGIERLREIAGLEAITPMVPVTFTLGFGRD
jgi:polyisoprenoid-binding protein YceI